MWNRLHLAAVLVSVGDRSVTPDLWRGESPFVRCSCDVRARTVMLLSSGLRASQQRRHDTIDSKNSIATNYQGDNDEVGSGG